MTQPPICFRMWWLVTIQVAVFVCASAIWQTASGDEVRQAAGPLTTTVGEYGRIKGLVLPGTMLRAKPIRAQHPKIVLRLAAIYPHGTNHRYDMEYYGLEPGQYDLRDQLERVDGGSTSDLPAIPVMVRSLLPMGQILPNAVNSERPPRIGGYTRLAIVVAGAWTLGLLAILFARRRNLKHEHAHDQPASLADFLRPRLEAARNGDLSPQQYAELERWIVEAWRRRLGMCDMPASDALIRLRADETAGPPLRKLEQWLHQPESAARSALAEILQPYHDWPADGELPANGTASSLNIRGQSP